MYGWSLRIQYWKRLKMMSDFREGGGGEGGVKSDPSKLEIIY